MTDLSGTGRRALAPSLAVAAIAFLLQVAALASRPGSPVASGGQPELRMSYGEPPDVAIPRLRSSFLSEQTDDRYAPKRRADKERPGADDPSATPPVDATDEGSPTPSPTVSADEVSLNATTRVQPDTAHPGDDVTYEIVLRNTGSRTYAGTLTYSTHVPLWTAKCVDDGLCVIPGDYDGTSTDPDDIHVDRITRPVEIAPEAEQVVTLTVRVLPLAPSGSSLREHAHIDVTGDDETTQTILAPTVSIR